MTFFNLQSEDWDFSAVPDDELFACLVYEYGRENRSFMYDQELSDAEEKVKPHRLDYQAFQKAGYKGQIPRIANTTEEQAIAKKSLAYIRDVAKFDAEAFLHAFWNCDQGFIEMKSRARMPVHTRYLGSCIQKTCEKRWDGRPRILQYLGR